MSDSNSYNRVLCETSFYSCVWKYAVNKDDLFISTVLVKQLRYCKLHLAISELTISLLCHIYSTREFVPGNKRAAQRNSWPSARITRNRAAKFNFSNPRRKSHFFLLCVCTFLPFLSSSRLSSYALNPPPSPPPFSPSSLSPVHLIPFLPLFRSFYQLLAPLCAWLQSREYFSLLLPLRRGKTAIDCANI